MNFLKMFVFALVIICTNPFLALAQPAQPQLIDELLRRSGTEKQLQSYPQVFAMMSQEKFAKDTRLSSEKKKELNEVLINAFAPEGLLNSYKEYLATAFTDQELNDILQSLDQPLLKKMTQLEEEASSPEAYPKMEAFFLQMEANPSDPKRFELLEQMDQTLQITETAIKTLKSMMLTMSESIGVVCGEKVSREDLQKTFDETRPQMEDSMQQHNQAMLLFTYQTASNSELEEYINFYKTDIGQKYMKVMTQAQEIAFKNAGSKAGAGVGDLIKRDKAAK